MIGTNAFLALLFVLVFYFFATLFNSTIKGNYHIIQRWFSRISDRVKFIRYSIGKKFSGWPRLEAKTPWYIEGLSLVAICALIYSFLDPHFNSGLSGLALFLSLALAIGIVTMAMRELKL